MEIEIIPATGDHVIEMAPHMRKADRDEVWASSKVGPHTALFKAMKVTASPRTVLVDREVVCMFGVSSTTILSDVGSPWLLGTDKMVSHPLVFLKRSRDYFQGIRKEYKHLENYVDVRNEISMRWLMWLGFKMDEPKPYGALGLDFRRFWV